MSRSGKTAKPSSDEQSKSQPDSAVKSGGGREGVQRRPINFLHAAVILAVIVVGINLWEIFFIKDQELRTGLSDVIPFIVDLLVSIVLFIAAKYSAVRSKRLAIAWGTIALAILFYSLGDAVWLILEVGLKVEPSPSLADGFYLFYYPAFLVGTFLLLEKPATTGLLINRVLDMGIILGSAIIGFWGFLIGPLVSSNAGQPLLEQWILFAYPVGDLVLIGALLLIIYNPFEHQEKTPIYFLAGILLVTIVADSIYSYQSLLGTYVSGGFLDLSWIVASLLAGLAGASQVVSIQSTHRTGKTSLQDVFQDRLKALQPYVPYFWLAAVFVLLVRRGMGFTLISMGFLSLSLAVGGIIVLVIIRQIIALTENNMLNSRLQKSMERIQVQATELEKTNLELQTDIAERKHGEEALYARGVQLSEALRVARMAYWEYDVIHDQFKFNDQFFDLFHTTAEQEGGYSMSSARYAQRFVHPDDAALVGVEIRKALETTDPEYQSELDHRIIRADGETGYLSVHIRIEKDAQGRTVKTRGVNQDITGRKQGEAALHQSEALFRTLFELSSDAIVLIDPQDPNAPWPIVDCNAAACLMNGYTRDEMIGQSIDIINLAPSGPVERSAYMDLMRKGGINKYVTQHRRKDGTVFFVDVSNTIFTVGGRDLLLGIDHDITDRNRREDEIKHRLAELEAINKVSSDLRAAQTLEEILPLLLDTILEVMHAAQGSIWLYDPIKDELDPVVTRGFEAQTGMPPLPSVKPGAGIAGRVFASGQPYVSGDFQLYPNLSKTTRQLIPPGIGGAAIPIRAEENILGTIIVNVPFPRELTPDEVHLLTTLSEIAGIAIRRTSLRQQTDRRLRHLTALSEINRAITSSVDLHLNLTMLLNQVIAQLDIDAADVLLLNPILRTLDYAAGSGFRTRTVERAHQRMDEGYAGRAVMERHILYIPNLVERDDNPLIAKTLAGEAFVSYYAVPLLAKGQVKGVLEIFHRVPHEHDTEWLDFLNTLAEQAAIAIDNVTLFDNLQRSNVELVLAYDATIEGWSRALDLRDKETEGHTQRVADITVRLARTFSLSEAELVQVRWGALLHDIGKMGVPDEILLKPGPLTDDEWVIMKKHPVLAYEMLSPIHYLRSALDIPYHHHEKWDGTGYPLGLKGEQIPLTARIFAVVDVWDALRSDRPYRKGWSDEKAREHIRSLAGTHFDPKAVEVFLNAMSENA
jgi:PAS domain S-box-containing protein/putative nucleotidyltransferase with HDIG domain